VKRLSQRRLLKHLPLNDPVILVNDLPTLGRNRNYYQFGKLVHPNKEELPDEVKLRLLVARLKALEKHKEVWG